MPLRPVDESRWRVLGNELLAELRKLSVVLLGLQQQISSIRDQQEAASEHQEQKRQRPQILHAELQIPEAVQRQQSSNDNRQFSVQAVLAAVTFLAFVAAAIYAGIAHSQLSEMRKANETASDSFARTLGQMQAQTTAQGRFADAARRSADAAQRAANIAESALHVSERAYLVVGAFDVDEDTGSVKVPISNVGRIPSGPVEMITHEATIKPHVSDNVFKSDILEVHWSRSDVDSIVPNSTPETEYRIRVMLPAFSRKQYDSHNQQIVIAGTISYGDGFPDDPTRKLKWCLNTIYHPGLKEVLWTSCLNTGLNIQQMEKLDGYPENEQK